MSLHFGEWSQSVSSLLQGGNSPGGANKKMHMTPPARRSFSIIARYEGFGVASGCVLPVRARGWPVILGVSHLLAYVKLLIVVYIFQRTKRNEET